MPTVDTIRNLTIRGTSQGLDKVKADLDAVSAAQGRVSTSAAQMATVTDISTKRQLSATTQLERLAAQHDATYRAQQQQARGQAILDRAMAQGLSGTREFAIAQAAVNKLHVETGNVLNFNRMQMMESVHVVKSLADSMIAGASPLRAFGMEAGRIGQIFSEGNGGLAAGLKGAGSVVASLATGWVGLALAVGAVGVAAGAAALSYENAQERMQRALEGTGRASGMTVGQLSSAASAGAAAGGISGYQARDLASGFANAGFGSSLTASLTGSARRYGEFTGLGTSDAGRALVDAFSDPERGAAGLDKQLGFLNDRLQTTIHNYEASGNLEAARNALAADYNKALAETVDQTWGVTRAWAALKSTLSGGFYAVGGAIDRSVFGSRAGLGPTPEEAAAAKRDADANRLSNDAGPLIRSILPDIVRAQDANNSLNLLRSAMSDPLVLSKMGVSGSQVSQAFGNLTVQSANADPMKRMRQDYDLAIAAADAFSVAEKGAVDARRAELQVLRDTGDVSKATTAAQMAMNEAIAKSNSDAKDRLELARQEAGMVGMTSYERGRQQIINQFDGYGGYLSKDAASRSDISDAMSPVKADLKSAGQMIVDALHDVAHSISPSVGPYGSLNRGAFGGTGSPAVAAGPASANQVKMLNLLVAAGYSPAAAAGFVGGMTGESGAGLNPALTNSTGHFGIAQWDATRQAPLGGSTSFDAQAQLVLRELASSESRAGGMLRSATDVRGGLAANLAFERPSAAEIVSSYDKRLAAGNALAGTGANDNMRPMTVHGSGTGIALLRSTAAGSDAQARDQLLSNYDQAAALGPITAANTALASQRAALEASVSTWGQSTSAIAEAAEKQKLLNEYTSEHIPLTSELRAKIEATAAGYGSLAQATEDAQKRQQGLISAMDDVRGVASSGLGSFTSDLLAGKSAAEGLHDALGSITDKLANVAENGLINMLFGQTGTTGQGSLFGGGLMSLFGGLPKFAGGTDYAPGGAALVGEKGPEIVNLPQGSQVTPNDQIGGDVHFHTYVDGASGDAHIRGLVQQGVNAGIAQNNSRLPSMLQDMQRRQA